jgi:hypothetical protein
MGISASLQFFFSPNVTTQYEYCVCVTTYDEDHCTPTRLTRQYLFYRLGHLVEVQLNRILKVDEGLVEGSSHT